MSMPFYVSPEQVMADKAEYARKGIGRGKSSITLEFEGGIAVMAENPSSLSKIGEIYDRIAFAGGGCPAGSTACSRATCPGSSYPLRERRCPRARWCSEVADAHHPL
jgi:20S proteasome alpha/beta subunit